MYLTKLIFALSLAKNSRIETFCRKMFHPGHQGWSVHIFYGIVFISVTEISVSGQPGFSYETNRDFPKKRVARRDLGNRASTLDRVHMKRLEWGWQKPRRYNGFLEKQDRGSRIEDRGSRIEDRGSRIEDRGSRIEGRGSGIEDRGSRIEDQVTQKKTIKSLKLKPCDRPARLPLYANVHSGLCL